MYFQDGARPFWTPCKPIHKAHHKKNIKGRSLFGQKKLKIEESAIFQILAIYRSRFLYRLSLLTVSAGTKAKLDGKVMGRNRPTFKYRRSNASNSFLPCCKVRHHFNLLPGAICQYCQYRTG